MISLSIRLKCRLIVSAESSVTLSVLKGVKLSMRVLCRFGLLVLLVSLAAGCSWSSQDDEGEADAAPVLTAEQQSQLLVKHLLNKAQLAYETDRLLLPANDCAVDYYRQVLALEPGNAQAQRGLRQVVSRYLQLAKVAHGNGDDDQAANWLKRAEEVNGSGSRIDAVRSKLKSTPSGEDKRNIEYLPATDYLLSRDDLDERGPDIQQRLAKIAQRAQERQRGVLVLGRTNEEAAWILGALKNAVPTYRLKGRTRVAPKPAVLLLTDKQLADSEQWLSRQLSSTEKAQANQLLRQKTKSLENSDMGRQWKAKQKGHSEDR